MSRLQQSIHLQRKDAQFPPAFLILHKASCTFLSYSCMMWTEGTPQSCLIEWSKAVQVESFFVWWNCWINLHRFFGGVCSSLVFRRCSVQIVQGTDERLQTFCLFLTECPVFAKISTHKNSKHFRFDHQVERLCFSFPLNKLIESHPVNAWNNKKSWTNMCPYFLRILFTCSTLAWFPTPVAKNIRHESWWTNAAMSRKTSKSWNLTMTTLSWRFSSIDTCFAWSKRRLSSSSWLLSSYAIFPSMMLPLVPDNLQHLRCIQRNIMQFIC